MLPLILGEKPVRFFEREPAICPFIFLLSMGLAFTLVSALGYFFSSRNLFENFKRFSPAISVERQFYPTFSEMLNLSRSRKEPGKALVVVAGDSVFYGLGQDAQGLWTEDLSRHLGGNATVVNLAFRGGGMLEGGYYVFEALSRQYDDVILVTNTLGARAQTAGSLNSPYHYIYLDGKMKGYLIRYEQREKYFSNEEAEAEAESSNKGKLAELKLASFLDSYLYFRDLWSRVNYAYFSPVYCKSYGPMSFGPRKLRLSEEHQLVRDAGAKSLGFFTDLLRDRFTVRDPGVWAGLKRTILSVIPESLRDRVVVVQVMPNPECLTALSTEEITGFESTVHASRDLYRSIGIESAVVNTIPVDGYVDGLHLNDRGGKVLAATVADLVMLKLKGKGGKSRDK